MDPNLSLGAGRRDTFLVAMDETSLFVWETSLFVVDTFLVATPHSRGPVPPRAKRTGREHALPRSKVLSFLM